MVERTFTVIGKHQIRPATIVVIGAPSSEVEASILAYAEQHPERATIAAVDAPPFNWWDVVDASTPAFDLAPVVLANRHQATCARCRYEFVAYVIGEAPSAVYCPVCQRGAVVAG
jgi:hypothetical protein